MSTGGGGGGQNTVTQTQVIPAYQQQFSQENQDIARSLGAQPFPVYQAPQIAGMTGLQNEGVDKAVSAATAQSPYLDQATQLTSQAAVNPNAQWANALAGGAVNPNAQWANELAGNATNPNAQWAQDMAAHSASLNPADTATMAQFMSPFVEQSLRPQIAMLQNQIGQQHQDIAKGATGAGAFGDSRQGAYDALADFYGNTALSGLVGQGYNTAFSNAQDALRGQQSAEQQAASISGGLGQGQQAAELQRAGLVGSMGQAQQAGQLQQAGLVGSLGKDTQAGLLSSAGMLGNLGAAQQGLGISGANAIYNAGTQQQTAQQNQLTNAYQNFLNQANWPFQMLNIRSSALSNSPYNIQTATTLPSANGTAQGFGGAMNIAGLLGALSGGNTSPFGGATTR
jgi:hypothetical protein